jgi:mRNA-degrading endonuclease YafQ of YafQ-DinJ toxin-antitoxin module
MDLATLNPSILIAAIINIGSAVAVIVVVDRFLKFIKEMNAQNDVISARLANVINLLVARVESLETKFEQHDATEMEFLRNVVGNMERQPERQTQPRGRKPNA